MGVVARTEFGELVEAVGINRHRPDLDAGGVVDPHDETGERRVDLVEFEIRGQIQPDVARDRRPRNQRVDLDNRGAAVVGGRPVIVDSDWPSRC